MVCDTCLACHQRPCSFTEVGVDAEVGAVTLNEAEAKLAPRASETCGWIGPGSSLVCISSEGKHQLFGLCSGMY